MGVPFARLSRFGIDIYDKVVELSALVLSIGGREEDGWAIASRSHTGLTQEHELGHELGPMNIDTGVAERAVSVFPHGLSYILLWQN